jgi:hypothetical protein
MRALFMIVGLIVLATGLLWIGQGTGMIAWPQSSFMIGQINWAMWGAGLALIGLFFIGLSKRNRR